jgi:hypothetical protein
MANFHPRASVRGDQSPCRPFIWYRTVLTIPAKIGNFETIDAKAVLTVCNTICQKETCRSLLNDLVGKSEQIGGERETKLSCSPLVDDQLKSCGLHDRNIGGFGAL